MSTPNTGGPAFPNSASPSGMTDPTPGMTLRDWFAGQALTATLLAPGDLGRAAQTDPDKAACWAYQQADSMLYERAKQEAKP